MALGGMALPWLQGVVLTAEARTIVGSYLGRNGVDATRVSREAAGRGVEVAPLSAYFAERPRHGEGLVLGFAAVRPDAARRGM